MKRESTEVRVDFKGAYLLYGECQNCKQKFQTPAENRFNFCPYCGRRVKYKEEKYGNGI